MRRRFIPSCCALVFVAQACAARKPGSDIKPGINFFSKDQDVQLGKEAAAQVRQQYQIVQNSDLQNYVSRIGKRLADQAEADKYPYTFTVVNDKSINAFALPGGPAFVHTGLIAAADNEAQVAGVLAHEISHVALRHATNQASKANLLQIPAVLAGAAAGSGSMLGQLSQLGVGLGFNSVLLKFSRTAESQADALGTHIMAKAGYNPIEMARFFEKLEAEGGSRAPEFLSDHPNPGNRVKAVEDEIRALPQGNYTTGDSGEFQRMKSLVSQIPPASRKQANNYTAPNAPSAGPSGGYKQFQSQQFSLSYPDNWQAFGDNNSSSVTIAPRDGLVQGPNGNTAVGYGVIVSYFAPESRQKVDLKQTTDELVHHLHANNPSMQVKGNSRKVSVDGKPGMVTELTSDSPYQGNSETDMLLTVARPEGLFYMVFIAPQRQFGQLQSTFDQVVRSIRFNG